MPGMPELFRPSEGAAPKCVFESAAAQEQRLPGSVFACHCLKTQERLMKLLEKARAAG